MKSTEKPRLVEQNQWFWRDAWYSEAFMWAIDPKGTTQVLIDYYEEVCAAYPHNELAKQRLKVQKEELASISAVEERWQALREDIKYGVLH